MKESHQYYEEFYKKGDWNTNLTKLKYQLKSYLKYCSFEQKLPPKSILDIGCGTGDYVAILSSMGYEAYGIDFAKTAIDKAKEKYTHLKFKQADAINMDMNETFDLLLVNGFSVFNTEDLKIHKKIISSWKDLLTENGAILIISRTSFACEYSSTGWFYHTERQLKDMYSHEDFNTKIYYTHPKLRYSVLVPFLPNVIGLLVDVISKYIIAGIFKIPIQYIVVMTSSK